MSVPPVNPSSLPAIQTASQPPQTSTAGQFEKTFSKLLDKANQTHVDADQSIDQMIAGETESLHEVVMSVAKADMSFRLLLEIRNRLIDSYQEIMRMQV